MIRRLVLNLLLACIVVFAAVRSASATEMKISAKALERTLRTQLFNGPEGRYYIRGDARSTCFVYADDPHVSFVQDRIVVHVHTKSKLGAGIRGACVGVSLATEADVSLIPDAEGEAI